MKKLLSLVMVFVLVLSLGIAAFAADVQNDGSITITNATVGKTYSIYKIFDASIQLADDGETAEAVAYTIKEDSQFFDVLFGEEGTGYTYFVYNENTGSVTKKEGVNDADLINYLKGIVTAEGAAYEKAADDIEAAAEEITFDNIPYGYYLVFSTLGSTVTVTSNTPDVEVIDKNQEPATDFDKLVQTGVDEDGNPTWGESNSASIGEKITYKINFTATNYDGDKKVKYYQVHDEKGNAIWVEFESIKVVVNGVELDRGYYLSQGGDNTDNWEYLGDWTGYDEDTRTRDDAQWYLVHLDYDKFRITIPWLEGHRIEDVTNADGDVTAYSVVNDADAESAYDSPASVVITYDAAIEPTADIGTTTHGNRFNKAHASWTSDKETGTTPPEEVVTYVYGLGILKDDGATGENLAGAKFRIYSDEACTQPVYVIPTTVDGVYIVDSLGADIEDFSGNKKDTSRELYPNFADYLGTNTQDNYVVSQVNGKLVVLGLKAGTYYLKEVEAPAGYNALTTPVALTAGTDTRTFSIYADANGKVADIQAEDGVHNEIPYSVTYQTVHNNKGVELPSTGGTGTFWLITIGTVLAIGFAVFLITNKKMSVYND